MHYPSFTPAHRPRFFLPFPTMKYLAGRLAPRCGSASA